MKTRTTPVRAAGPAIALACLIGGCTVDPHPVQTTDQGTPGLARQRPPTESNLACTAGEAGPYPCDRVDLLSYLDLSRLGGSDEANDIWGWTDPSSGNEYAIVGMNDGTAFVDVTSPSAPVYLGRLPTHSQTSIWRDIKVYQGHALIVSEASDHGVQIFDLAQLGDIAVPPVTLSETAHYDGLGTAHNIAVNEDSGFAYAVGTDDCGTGMHMIDVSEPAEPVFAGCYSGPVESSEREDDYTHDTHCVVYHGPDADHAGREICINSDGTFSGGKLTVADTTDKETPVRLAEASYSGVGYVHQGWLTEDHEYFLLGDEFDEQQSGHPTKIYIWDVRDLDAPELIGIHTGATPAIDHNLYVKGRYAYLANYEAGLRVLDTANVADGELTEVGFFDVFPESDDPDFSGAWSSYPFFDSGIVVVSSIDEGLFVLRPTL